MRNFFGSWKIFFLSLLLLPVCYGVGRSFFEMMFLFSIPIYFILGFVVYTVIHFIFFKPLSVYVFGHELTHALAGVISGYRIKSFKVNKSGGNVTLSKSNIFVTLSPYFVPVYSIILILLYIIINRVFKGYPFQHNYFLFLLGVALAFHIALTIFAIHSGQSDLKKYGMLFSLIIVFIANCVVLTGLFSLFFGVSLLDFLFVSLKNSRVAVLFVYQSIQSIQFFQENF